jgi:hypothetical protein
MYVTWAYVYVDTGITLFIEKSYSVYIESFSEFKTKILNLGRIWICDY